MRKLTFKSPGYRGWTENVALLDNVEELINAPTSKPTFYGSWYGNQDRETCVAKMRSGDLSLVPASDKLLSKLEAIQGPATNMWRNVDAVTGGIPNVPALLAGHPVAMRRRQRVAQDLAPLTVVVDMVSSGGIESAALEKRGAAILALVRLLAGRRAVELWAGCYATNPEMGNGRQNMGVFFRMDTTPVDLGRAAHLLCAASVSRGIGYGSLDGVWCGGSTSGSLKWPYQKFSESRPLTAKAMQHVFGGEILFIAGAFNNEPITKDPAGWLTSMIEKYSQPTDEAA